jgi:PBP1b-binding outer membrane lipoprotein LpoB
MKKLIISLIASGALVLSGCSALPNGQVTVNTQQMQTRIVQSCVGFYAAYSAAFQLLAMNKLNAAEKVQVEIVANQVMPVCTQKQIPSDPTVAISQITAGIATLTALEIAHGINPNTPTTLTPAPAASSTVSR